MENVFENRERQLELKRKFEKKIWTTDESFQEYFYEKLIMSTKLNISQDELVEYVIDGIPDYALRTQARMQRFTNTNELLDAFKKIQLEPENKYPQKSTQKNNVLINAADSSTMVKCYNCNSKGHMANECRKPNRAAGACFVCAEMGHVSNNCTKRKDLGQRESTDNNNPYVRSILFIFLHKTNYTTPPLETLIDTGICLIREEHVPTECIENLSVTQNYCGINNSKLKIIRKTESYLKRKNLIKIFLCTK